MARIVAFRGTMHASQKQQGRHRRPCLIADFFYLSDYRRVDHLVSVHVDHPASDRADHLGAVPGSDDHRQGGCRAGVRHTG